MNHFHCKVRKTNVKELVEPLLRFFPVLTEHSLLLSCSLPKKRLHLDFSSPRQWSKCPFLFHSRGYRGVTHSEFCLHVNLSGVFWNMWMTYTFDDTLTLYSIDDRGRMQSGEEMHPEGWHFRDSWNSEVHSNLRKEQIIAIGHWGFNLRNSQKARSRDVYRENCLKFQDISQLSYVWFSLSFPKATSMKILRSVD